MINHKPRDIKVIDTIVISQLQFFVYGKKKASTPPSKLTARRSTNDGWKSMVSFLKWSLFRGHVESRELPYPTYGKGKLIFPASFIGVIIPGKPIYFRPFIGYSLGCPPLPGCWLVANEGLGWDPRA